MVIHFSLLQDRSQTLESSLGLGQKAVGFVSDDVYRILSICTLLKAVTALALNSVGGLGLGLTIFILFPPLALSLYVYLASLAISDTFVLLFYVLVEWLHRGMGRWPAGRPLNLAALHPGTTSLHI